jgi:hypothetical protein
MSAVAEKIREYYASNCTDYTEEKKLFLEGLRERGVVQGGLDLARISRTTAYMWRSLDPEFRRAWDEVKEACNDNVRQTIYQQAVSGKNALYSIFYAKHNCPEYRERVTIDVNMVQSEVEERLSVLANRLPSASTKDLISEALGLPRRSTPSSTTATAVEVEASGTSSSSSSE